ncbi:uncharacterized protein EV422DRAFT_508086 [Fimicolochytrium jonesii]|uniref:uncharacterized protein n=1 Tax=Fimicolochytrium jonesii TaxID=1396493 RepID=UPI0022FF1DF9|nr:uncharacterized protein EV422DRAFT_508086 [Fimicolochytrium jonesii]KAI8818567.1 hypothetical protein EV422DRAFT_508086 [Fimicolochytrium jonesii]
MSSTKSLCRALFLIVLLGVFIAATYGKLTRTPKRLDPRCTTASWKPPALDAQHPTAWRRGVWHVGTRTPSRSLRKWSWIPLCSMIDMATVRGNHLTAAERKNVEKRIKAVEKERDLADREYYGVPQPDIGMRKENNTNYDDGDGGTSEDLLWAQTIHRWEHSGFSRIVES